MQLTLDELDAERRERGTGSAFSPNLRDVTFVVVDLEPPVVPPGAATQSPRSAR